MVWSEDLRAVHRGLSPQDLQFREAACDDPELLSRATFRKLVDDKGFIAGTLQPWLTFVGPEKMAELRSVSVGLAGLLRTAPERVLGNDPVRVHDYYGLETPEILGLFLSRPNGAETAIGRGDLIDTASGFQCLEFNFTPNLGGWETSEIARLHLGVPATARYLRERGIPTAYTSTGRELFAHLIRSAQARGHCPDGELNVALVVPEAVPAGSEASPALDVLRRDFQQACRDSDADLTGDLLPCHFSELTAVRNYLFLRKSRIHAVAEFCDEPTAPAAYRSFKAEKLTLLNGPIRAVLSSKLNLALLSESAESGVYSSEERDFIRRHVPWTRKVARGATDFRGERVSLPDLLASRREALVLKEATSSGGEGVAIGLHTPQARWDELARQALDAREGGWVAQERVESLPYLYQSGEHGCVPHDLIWGPFVFGERYGGVILRMQPKSVQGAVNSALGATSGIVFEV
ncbi:MAG TPA: hypothetical protein VL025_16370 [Thermoanaerobaculia bacterium]|nr:hypothetical protein [Thermoanaerobaculia bacterium]